MRKIKRHLPQHLHLVIATGIFLAILVLAAQIVGRHNRRLDLTRERLHSVSNDSIAVLYRMQRNPLWVRAFFAEEDPARHPLRVLLKEMATHHPQFHYEFYDPDRSPSEARRYRVETYRTTVVEYQGREEKLQEFSEEALTNALIRLAHPERQTLCFTAGHGEAALTDTERNGLAEWKQALEDHSYRLKEIQLLGRGIPTDCASVVVAGPHYELLPGEVDRLQKHLETGRGLLLLIDPMDPWTGKSFQKLVEPWGVRLGENVVVDKMSRVFGGDYLIPLVTEYADHPITKRFRVATFLPITRTVRMASEVPEGVEVTELARTTQGSWAETNLKKLEEGKADLEPETDLVGPVSVAAAVQIEEIPKGGRVVVVGDSDFVTNAYLKASGNKDFSLNLVQWLVKDDRWISIRAKRPRFEPLFLKKNQSVGVAIFTVVGLPLTALAAGSIGIWRRRRRSA